MATWKENGEVPDSDDDEDSQDSQSVAGRGNRGTRLPDSAHDFRSVSVETSGLEPWSSFFIKSQTLKSQNPEDDRSFEGVELHTEECQEKWIALQDSTANPVRPPRPSATENATCPPSSPTLMPIFQVPQLFLDLEYDKVSHLNGEDFGGDSRTELPRVEQTYQEEISTTYVRINSPASLTSSPPLNLCQSKSSKLQGNSQSSHHSASRQYSLKSPTSANKPVEQLLVGTLEEPRTFRRSLRQRNPIQLHPYVVEQETYRRILKARGLTPMRIAESQDDGRRMSPSASLRACPSPECFDAIEAESMEIDWDSVPPSSGSTVDDENDENEDQQINPAMSADEEFPDIDELLRRKVNPGKSVRAPEPVHKISSKSKVLRVFGRQSVSSRPYRQADTDGDMLDLPVSPPTSSSPVFSAFPRNRRPSSEDGILASKCPSPDLLAHDNVEVLRRGDLPTPMTSTTKPPPINIAFGESDSDSDDPFAEELKTSRSSSLSSDESVDLHRLSKRTRGVLPASHLRLDLHPKKVSRPHPAHRNSQSLSPGRPPTRRGIALPKAPGSAPRPTGSDNMVFSLISDESEIDSIRGGERRSVSRHAVGNRLGNFPDEESRLGFAEEDDEVDAMLPTRKRKSKGPSGQARKRVRAGTNSGLDRYRSYERKSIIFDHFTKPRSSKNLHKTGSGFAVQSELQRKQHHASRIPSNLTLPKISILDVMEDNRPLVQPLPQFMRLAARASRSRKHKGRQSPSKKFIRLANREDTADAQSLLTKWRNGEINPRGSGFYYPRAAPARRPALHEISVNRQIRLPSSVPVTKPRSQAFRIAQASRPRKLVVSKPVQTSMNEFITACDPAFDPALVPCESRSRRKYQSELAKKTRQAMPHSVPLSRPAQLESTEAENSSRNPAAAFRNTKKALDVLYRYGRKRAVPDSNLQLKRFLADDDIVRPSIEQPVLTQINDTIISLQKPASERSGVVSRPRKRAPQRIDAGAAQYRQLSEPLVLEYQASLPPDITEPGSKLIGLGKFGTNYPRHFDILPLQPGTFFHESTFIGSGRLSNAIRLSAAPAVDSVRSRASFWLGEKELRWGPWDEVVSSEIGLFFDWLLERLTVNDSPVPDHPSPNVISTLNFLVDYLQHYVSFPTAPDQKDFICRMSEILLEFCGRLEQVMSTTVDHKQIRYAAEVATICALISTQVLRLSLPEGQHFSMNCNPEDVLEKFAHLSVKLLLSRGLDDIRKLYDDLQYIAVRERGIRTEHYAAQAWVIIWTLLGTTKIPRVSFWDVTNHQLKISEVDSSEDARAMEKLWYSMFSLLPLCEFDPCGVIISSRRFKASFDNWAIPQRILKRVIALYSSSSQQSPGFNDYCRAILGRCHYLMAEWGWWECRTIIGTMFDFFASQNLAHLRNEEVHKSPQFLEELDHEPSLSLEVEDRCFHIFLKILALAIRHMRYAGNEKEIRNLVARVLPNHGRQYPKEEDIRERELASLRNHHDLLCTIYWASPVEQRSSPDLIDLLQKLVVPDLSHKAACLINIRSWSNLARFVLTLINNDSSMAMLESYKLIRKWQIGFFKKVFEQYLGAEKEAYAQADLSSAREFISETQLRLVIATNQRSTLDVLRQNLVEMSHVLDPAKSVTALLQAFSGELMAEIWNPSRWGCEGMDREVGTGCLVVLNKYIDRLEAIKPFSSPVPTEPVEFDSQDSMFSTSDVDRQTLIYPLFHHVLPNFAAVLRSILHCQLYRKVEPQSLPGMIRLWARMAALMTEDMMGLDGFVSAGQYAIFEQRRQHKRAMKWWPLFLAVLLEKKGLADLSIADFNLELEWILAITQPASFESTAYALTEQLCEKDHYYFTGHDPFAEQHLEALEGLSNAKIRPKSHLSTNSHAQKRQRLITAAIMTMRNAIKDASGDQSSMGRSLKRETEALFSNMLLEMMTSMKWNLESMILSTDNHIEYVTFCQQIIALVRSHASDIRPVIDFFIHPSIFYWPEKSDPKLYAAGLISYIIRLSEQPGKTSFELFYYLFNGWKSQTMNMQMGSHAAFVYQAMKHNSFVKFVLVDFLPAALSIGFSVPIGWIISADYLPALARQIPKLFQRTDPEETAATFQRIINLLKIIMNGLGRAMSDAGVSLQASIAEDRGLCSMSCLFLLSVAPTLRTYASGRPHMSASLEEVLDAFVGFSRHFSTILSGTAGHAWFAGLPNIMEGKHVRRFTNVMSDDIKKNWVLQENRRIVIQGTGANHDAGFMDLDAVRQHIPPLHEIIKSALPTPSKRFMEVLF